MTSCLQWSEQTVGRVKEERLNLWPKFVSAVVVVSPPEKNSATKARFDLVVVGSCT